MTENAFIPPFFAEALNRSYSSADAERILQGCISRRVTTFRANTLRSCRDEIEHQLAAACIPWESVPWYSDAFVSDASSYRMLLDTEAYRTGGIYVQSLSSMLPPLALDVRKNLDILDMCAAPGGKTTQIAALANGKAHITACEMHAPRAERLEHNLDKLGATNVTIMRADARRLDDFFAFDRILLDAPCSGSGTWNAENARLQKRFTPDLIRKSRKSQQALLSKALSLLKPGGIAVYSTCSILPEENEEIVAETLKRAGRKGEYQLAQIQLAGIEEVPLLPAALEGTLTICPTARYEGFFIAKIVRS